MGKYKEVKGDLIEMALKGEFDVIAHGCNCFCIQGAGIAYQMAETFDTHLIKGEEPEFRGKIDKLGNIQSARRNLPTKPYQLMAESITVVNAYTQYLPGANLDYHALFLCLKKMNVYYKGFHIGLPQIGCGIGGGDWEIVKRAIELYLTDCDVTVVIYEPKQEETNT